MNVSVILLAGGNGARMGTPLPKQFLPLHGRIITCYSLEIFLQLDAVKEVILVCAPEYRHYFSNMPVKFATPGARRQDSVYNGLLATNPKNDWICSHDAARPFITSPLMQKLFEEAQELGAASLAMPVKNTLKTVHINQVEKTLDRSCIWEIQTPQIIKRNIIESGFHIVHTHSLTVTDDVSLAELAGYPVKLVAGSYENIKITTPEDLSFAEWFIQKKKSVSVITENQASIKYRMLISYDGTCYSGWQVQPNSVSIQSLIEKALCKFLKKDIRVIGAGRTDAGVHALGQVAHFTSEKTFDHSKIVHALNGMLPLDIRINKLQPTLSSFHAQHTAFSKEYHYHLWLEKTIDPFLRLYRHHYFYKTFSLTLLQEAAHHFLGTHDFAAFANAGGNVTSTVRTLSRLDIIEQEGGIRLEFEGNGFLYKMVRNIVGTLLEVATHRRHPDQIPFLLATKDRRQTGAAAPPRGLFLIKINYPDIF